MDFSNEFISIDTIVSSVAQFCADEDTKLLHKGRYTSFVQRALQELDFHTFFKKKRMDFVTPNNLRITLPPGTFNVDQVYAYDGDVCNINNAQKLWYKQNYYTEGGGFFAKNRGAEGTIDPFYPSNGALVRTVDTNTLVRREGSIPNEALYYAVENGVLMVSSAVLRWGKLHVIATGSSCMLGDAPMVPPIFREVVEDFACEAACRQLMARYPNPYVGLQREYKARMNKNDYYGSWYEAKKRVKRMSKGQRNDWAEYYQRGEW